MSSKFTLTKRKKLLIATVIICAVLVPSLLMLRQGGQVTQAALLVPHPGLVGWWRFDEGSGTVAIDSSGNGNNGTIYGTANWVSGRYGDALSFDGATNYVAVPDSPSLEITGAITLEAWVETNNVGKQAVITKSGGYLLYVGAGGDGKVYAYLYGTTSAWLGGTTNVADGLWHLIALTYDPNGGTNNFKLYVDGALEAQYTVTGSISSTSNRVGIGDRPDVGFRDFFNGTIDEPRIYNLALSASEIQADYQQSPDLSSNLLAKVPKGTTDFIATVSWQGTVSINVTIQSPSQTYTEGNSSGVYQKTTYSTSGGTSSMLNIKRVEVSTAALASDQDWYVTLTFDNPVNYQISVEVQT
jgi:hypothetical protein